MVRVKVSVNAAAVERAKKLLAERGMRVLPGRASVGIHEEYGREPKLNYEGQPTGESLARVAAAHEFGAGVPERSWLRAWFDGNRSGLIRDMAAAMREQYLSPVGSAIADQAKMWAEQLRQWISGGADLPAVKPQTVAAKSRAGLHWPEVPLRATSQLVDAIKAKVDEGET